MCYCDPHLWNFLLENKNDASSCLIVIDFEHVSWLPDCFLIWELWRKCDRYMKEQVLSRAQLEPNSDNIDALID